MTANEFDLQALEKKIEQAFPMPQTLTRILSTIDDPNSNLAQLEQIIKIDTNFTFKILSLANSAFYGLPNKITSMHTALSILGIQEIKRIAFQVSASELFIKSKGNAQMTVQDLWQHSVGVGVAAQMMARRLKTGNADDFFTMGILHDMGLLLVAQLFSDKLEQIINQIAGKARPMVELEKEAYGLDHAYVTAKMCEKWSLPEFISQSVLYHHLPLEAPEDYRQPVALLYLADRLVIKANYGFHYNRAEEEEEEQLLQLLGWGAMDYEIMEEDFQEQAEKYSSMLMS